MATLRLFEVDDAVGACTVDLVFNAQGNASAVQYANTSAKPITITLTRNSDGASWSRTLQSGASGSISLPNKWLNVVAAQDDNWPGSFSSS